jgi:hypothetical protein
MYGVRVVWGSMLGYRRREIGCGFVRFRFTFRGLVKTIRLDEEFEVFLKVETELWSFSLDVAIWDF